MDSFAPVSQHIKYSIPVISGTPRCSPGPAASCSPEITTNLNFVGIYLSPFLSSFASTVYYLIRSLLCVKQMESYCAILLQLGKTDLCYYQDCCHSLVV